MKRFALIIEASEVPGETVLPGAKADADTYHNWLYSRPGGDWFGEEIVTLHTPAVAEVRRALAQAGKVDYAFITFSGHGYHAKELDLTKVCLRDGQMTVRSLIPDTDRCTVVVDACRNVMAEEIREAVHLSTAVLNKAAAATRNFRAEFERQVGLAEKGAEFLYSCDLDESAGEGRAGGYFSRSLVVTGELFAEQNADGRGWLPMNRAFGFAAAMTTDRNRFQHPQFEPGRRLAHFPFGV